MHTIRCFFCKLVYTLAHAMHGSRGGSRTPPLKNHKSVEFFCNTGPDPLKFSKLHWPVPCADPEGGGGGVKTSPMKNHKNIEFLSNTGQDPLKFSKLPSQHSMLHHHRHASSAPFKWSFAGGPMMAPLLVIFGSSLP